MSLTTWGAITPWDNIIESTAPGTKRALDLLDDLWWQYEDVSSCFFITEILFVSEYDLQTIVRVRHCIAQTALKFEDCTIVNCTSLDIVITHS